MALERKTYHHPKAGIEGEATELAYTVAGGMKSQGWKPGPLPKKREADSPPTDKED